MGSRRMAHVTGLGWGLTRRWWIDLREIARSGVRPLVVAALGLVVVAACSLGPGAPDLAAAVRLTHVGPVRTVPAVMWRPGPGR